MKFTVIFRTEARDEAIEAAEYIATQGSHQAADEWYRAIEAAVVSLAEMPARCQPARESAKFAGVELRQLICKSHRLIFMIRGREVHVLHVRHVARDEIVRLQPREP